MSRQILYPSLLTRLFADCGAVSLAPVGRFCLGHARSLSRADGELVSEPPQCLEPPFHPETKAIRELISGWSAGSPIVTIDLHCPWISGDTSEIIYQPGRKDPEKWAEQQKFGRLLEAVRRGPLPYYQKDDLPFGKAWNVDSNSSDGVSFSKWAQDQPGVRLALGLEIPYANANGVAVTAESARAFGSDLARALKVYLQNTP